MNEKDVVKAARELNKVLGLEPRIDVKLPLEELAGLVLEAAELVEPEDEITAKTQEIIEALREEFVADDTDDSDDMDDSDDSDADDAEDGDSDAEEESEPDVPEPADEPDEIETDKPAQSGKKGRKTPPKNIGEHQTRHSIAALIIKSTPESISRNDLIAKINKQYSGGPNMIESSSAARRVIQCLSAYGVITYKDGIITKAKE